MVARQKWADKESQELYNKLNESDDMDDVSMEEDLRVVSPDTESDSETVKKECSSSKALKKYWWVDEFQVYVNKDGDPEKCRVKPHEVRNTLSLYMIFEITSQLHFSLLLNKIQDWLE